MKSFGARRIKTGISGVLGGVKSTAQMLNILRPAFAPSSTLNAPLSTQPGNRSAISSIQQAVVPLVAGALTWPFPTPFNRIPVVVVTPIGTSGGATLFIADTFPTMSAVQVISTSNTDTRLVNIIAVGNPN